MAAMRSAMAMLGRRSRCSFGSSAASSMGRGQRPPAVRNLESWRHFSTGGRELKGRADSFPRILWQWAKNRVENMDPLTQSKALFVYAMVVMGTPTLYMLDNVRKWRPNP